jgi:threonylcarbamoyladenosine tRNA methylthiotransferase MtaB
MKTVKIFTLGCKANQYDSQLIREKLLSAGYREIHNGTAADLCVINTCTVTHHADSDSLNIMRRAIRQNPKARIAVTGCLTELDSDKIKNIAGVSIIVKNSDKENIIPFLGRKFSGKRQPPIAYPDKVSVQSISRFSGHNRAFVKIQDGCDNFCSYCKVPLVRGRSRSRLASAIAQEARRLVDNGFKEVVLCGICLGAYGRDLTPKADLVDAVEQLENIRGLLRIRLSSIEVKDVSERLIGKMAASKKLCRHLHIPLQSGDDEILKKMNRSYSARDYARLIAEIKKRIPGLAITTDVMVGFPEESADNFMNTVKLVKKVSPLKVHIFPYSRRPQTQASARYSRDIDPKIIKERSLYLQGICEQCALNYKKQFLNQKIEVLFEGKSKLHPGFWEGYTGNYLKVFHKSGRDLANMLMAVKLKEIEGDYILV